MHRGLLCLLTLAAGLPAAVRADPGPPPLPPEPIRPPYYSCSVEREVPNGTVNVFKLIEPSGRGRSDTRLHTWLTELAPGGIQLQATWTDEPPTETGWIDILYPMETGQDVYRIQVLRSAPADDGDELHWESGLRQPRDGSLQVQAPWGPFLGLLAGAPTPTIAVRAADGEVIRGDPVDLTGFARAVTIGDSLEPELDAMVADYRNRCELIERLGVPVSLP